MTNAEWTNEDVQGFVARLESFYGELTETERAMFVERLLPEVDAAGAVAGFAARGQAVAAEVIGERVAAFLKPQV